MYVRQLVGNRAGSIVEMPFDVAVNKIENGTAEAVTEDEILAARDGEPIVQENFPEGIPTGYQIKPDEMAGFLVFDAGGCQLNRDVPPYRNLAEARSAAWSHYEHAANQAAATTVAEAEVKKGRPVGGSKAAAAAAAEAEAAALAAAEEEAKAKAAAEEKSKSETKEGDA